MKTLVEYVWIGGNNNLEVKQKLWIKKFIQYQIYLNGIMTAVQPTKQPVKIRSNNQTLYLV